MKTYKRYLTDECDCPVCREEMRKKFFVSGLFLMTASGVFAVLFWLVR